MMAVLSPGRRPRTPPRAPGWAVLTLLALAAAPAARAEDDNVFYSRQTTFRIPFQVDPGDRRVQQVLLYVSEDQGRTYRRAATAEPGDRGFNFQALRDGWYYFTVQTRDQEGRLYPATIDGAPPGLKVHVDTTVPEVVLRARSAARPNLVGVEWDVRDENLDLSTLRLDYRAERQDWVPRNVPRVLSGQLSWDPGTEGPVEVRLQVKDRAGNLGESTVAARGDGSTPVRRGDPAAPDRGEGPAAGRKVNSPRISLNYKVDDVGPSGVKVVEVWMTTNTRDWQAFSRDTSNNPPVVVDVQREGRYGFTLVAKSGVDLGEQPPRAGEGPQIWVEVDMTKPVVDQLAVVVGRGAETGSVTITWRAADKNLGQRPVSILYAPKLDGKWAPVLPDAVGIENTGRFVWRMPGGLPYEFFVRVEAIDEAGNIGEATTPQTVKVDLSLPKARVIGIEPAKP